MFRALVLLIVYIALGLPAAIIGIPWALVTGDITPAYRMGIAVAAFGLRVAGIRIETEWRAQLDPAKKYLFFSNHLSNLDPPVLIPLLPGRTSIFIKRSLLRIPILGYGMKLAGFIPVDRDGTVEGARQSVDRAAAEMARGASTSRLSSKERARATAACCPSKKARSIWPWKPARRSSPSPFAERKSSCPKAASKSAPEPSVSSSTRRSTPPTTPRAKI